MSISFAPLKKMIPVSRLKHSRVIGGGTYDRVRAAMDTPIKDGISISAVDAICAYLNCQPGDIMEYVPDKPHAPTSALNGP